MRELSMKEDMYTYHYFKNRVLDKKVHTQSYLMSTILFLSTIYLASTLFILFK